MNTRTHPQEKTHDARADAFVSARLRKEPINSYPGELPKSLSEAYAIQNEAIQSWPEKIVGWKVGRITGPLANELGTNRLAGPVFENAVFEASNNPLEMAVFQNGFAAVEGEVTAIIGKDVPDGKTSFTTEDALDFIQSMNVGVEIASSPFGGINEHGPLVTISDFGNNYGLILGREIEGWKDMALQDWTFITRINGKTVGENTPQEIPGGPVESVRFLLENTARRGLPLQKGMLVLTGAVTGVHQAYVGDEAIVQFQNDYKIMCRLIKA